MINTKIINIDAKSYTTITTLTSFITSIISLVIAAIIILFVSGPLSSILKLYHIPNNVIIYLIPILLVSIIITTIINFIINYANAKIYNYLLKYTTGIQIELTPHNEVKEIDLIHSSIAITLVYSVWLCILTIIISLMYILIVPPVLSALNVNITAVESILASSLPIVIFLIVLISMIIGTFISSLISIFILNFWLNKNPLKLDIIEKEQLEIKKIDITSLIMTFGLTAATIGFLTSILNIFTSSYADIALYSMIISILTGLISITIQGFAYNIIADKLAGIKLEIIPSDNITPEYVHKEEDISAENKIQ